ncbi:hemerythrin domain-containing protein [Alicyclobacillus sp.]|uniref:hemerythrin domain-containing protein n=1 Tax=Alicyclobacillus sp. TaxID=61169 RepID=UPI0025C32076|nr:hemerythrin domain-containing protein [Alicyclobacillus sp.]MCL6517203.1 hemerythrin domain-containing protein [Alicyclobacillus sp.]
MRWRIKKEAMEMERFSLEFQSEKVRPVFRLGESRVVQLSLGKGGLLDNHKTTHTLMFLTVNGQVRFTAGDEEQILGAGDGVIVEPLREHRVEALEDTVALLTLIPAPAQDPSAADDASLAQPPVCAYTNPALLEQIDPALRPFVEDHMDLCRELERAKDPFDRAAVQRILDAIGEELERHFVYEEEILFPRLTRHLGGPDVGPVPKLLKEHRMVRDLHRASVEVLSAWDEPAPSQGRDDIERIFMNKLRELTALLWNHIEKEDNHLFTMASRILTPEEKAAVVAEMEQRERQR